VEACVPEQFPFLAEGGIDVVAARLETEETLPERATEDASRVRRQVRTGGVDVEPMRRRRSRAVAATSGE
jgi:hypothetical protein